MYDAYPLLNSYRGPPATSSPSQITTITGGNTPITTNNYVGLSAPLPEQSLQCLVKVINPEKKSEYRVYTLKNVLSTYFDSLSELREQVASQLGSKVVSQRPELAIGYFSGQTKVWINELVWQLIQKSSNTMLWCDGYQERHLKRVRQSSPMISSDSDDDLGAQNISW